MRFSFVLALLLAPIAAAGSAWANGKFPAAGQLVVDPGDPSHLVVRTTFGLLTSRDAGETWGWICESAAGYGGNLDPGIAVTGDGTVLVGLLDGLGYAQGDTCAWHEASPIAGLAVADVSTEQADPAVSVALAVAPATLATTVYRANNNGVTWGKLGEGLPLDFRGFTLDVAPSNPSRVYTSGLRLVSGKYVGTVVRSDDDGEHWTVLAVPGSDAGSVPYLAAVDPLNPDVVYLRLDGAPGRLLVSVDAGEQWTTVFTGAGFLKAFTLSPDGATALVGGDTDGIWRADTATLAFEKIATTGALCLTWAAAGVYGCAKEAADGFMVGLSSDEGTSFTPLLHQPCISGPLACDPSTSVANKCPQAWPAIAAQIGAKYCGDAGVDGGDDDAGADASIEAPDAADDAGAEEPAGGGSSSAAEPSGCGCRAAPASAPSVMATGIAVAALALRRRSRRRATPRRR